MRAMRRALPWLGVALVVAVALVQMWRYGDFYYDDAFISLRYARRLVEGDGLTWTSGERVEGYTDLLWVLATAGLGWLGVDWVIATRLLGGLGFAAAIGAACVDPARPLEPVLPRVVVGGGLMALTGGLAIWAVGGLEHTLLAGLAACAVVALVGAIEGGSRLRVGVAAGLLTCVVLLRADGAVLWASALVGVALSQGRRDLLRLWPIAVLPALAVAGQEGFRLLYYGDWLPNTARAKVSFTNARAVRGLWWVGDGLLHHGVLVVGACAAVLVARGPRVLIPGCMAVTWFAYVAYVGGDFMAGWRMLVPGLPLLALLASEAASRADWRVIAVGALPALALHGYGANTGKWIDKAFDMWGWEPGEPVGRALRAGFSRYDPLLAVDAAGALPYYSQLRSLDMLGLTDAWLASHPPRGFGRDAIGHDLGDGAYVWSRKPDLILFNGTNGSTKPQYVSGRQLLGRRDFDDVYQYVNLRVNVGRKSTGVHLYVRREDGPLAIQRTPDALTIPGWFFARQGMARAALRQGDIVTLVTPENAGELLGLQVPAGRWTVELPPGLSAELRCDGSLTEPVAPSDAVVPADGSEVLLLEEPTRVDLQVHTTGEPATLGEVVLRRTDALPTLRCPVVPVGGDGRSRPEYAPRASP